MNNPTSESVFKVVENFKKVIPKTMRGGFFRKKTEIKGHLDMKQGVAKIHGECQTSMCHGGWYALATLDSRHIEKLDYNQGARRIASDLGFTDGGMLKHWVSCNVDVWGNSSGYHMFAAGGHVAFTSDTRPKGAETLQDIIDHWQEVGERLKALEEEEERKQVEKRKKEVPLYKDITNELAKLPVDETPDLVTVKELV